MSESGVRHAGAGRTRLLVALGFVVALAAGAVLGVAQDRSRRADVQGSWLAAELDLTPEQQEQVRKVWSEAMPKAGREHREAFDALLREREERVREILTEEQAPLYDEILAAHARKLEELKAERSRAIEAAQTRTKEFLTPTQRERYEELLREREHWPKHGGAFGPGRGTLQVGQASEGRR